MLFLLLPAGFYLDLLFAIKEGVMRYIISMAAFALLLASTWLALTLGVVEPVVRNIVYVHVPSSICALLCFLVVLIASIGYLATKTMSWDHLAVAAAEVGLVFATVLNITGSIFSRAEWGVWWTPSLRLITSAILWFLYVTYLILRSSVPSVTHRAKACAVFGIIAFLDVPMVYISARFVPDVHKATFSFDSIWQKMAFMFGLLGTFLLASLLIWVRRDILLQKNKIEQQLYS